jgi:hypothetical protein
MFGLGEAVPEVINVLEWQHLQEVEQVLYVGSEAATELELGFRGHASPSGLGPKPFS